MGVDVIPMEDSGKPDGGVEAERLNEDDQAARAASRFLEASLAKHRRTAWGVMAAKGACHNCGDPVQAAAIYCDDDCRADHARRLGR